LVVGRKQQCRTDDSGAAKASNQRHAQTPPTHAPKVSLLPVVVTRTFLGICRLQARRN
jgi:hypothetical protein